MTDKTPNSDKPYRSPSEVSDLVPRMSRTPLVLASVLLLVIAGAASAMFFGNSVAPVSEDGPVLDEYVTYEPEPKE